MSKYLNLIHSFCCKTSISDSLVKGDYWRLFTSKFAFLDTKDAILGLILLYQFR